MRIFVYVVFILFVILFTDDSHAVLTPAVVRVRMQKDLDVFPNIPGALYKKLSENLWSLKGDNLTINNKNLPRNNFIFRKDSGVYDIIALVEFNEYLAGVVSREMPASWPIEALKAQAVVARSYALARIKERNNKLFHLESDQLDQVYSASNSYKTKRAVDETMNLILVDQRGTVVKAFYHSDCGGETIPASEIWGSSAPDTGTAKDPWCAFKKSNKWNFEIDKNEFMNRLELSQLNNQMNQIYGKRQMIPVGELFFSVQKLREIFGFYNIRSSADSIEVADDKVKITGSGFGHGAGLCQWGTLAQVKMGRGYLDIIEHYYPKAKIVKESFFLTQNTVSNTVSN